MLIQFHTDKTISGGLSSEQYFSTLIEEKLDRFQSHISRIGVHLSDDNANRGGANDKRCLIEARIQGRKPIAVSYQSDTIEKALAGALEKIKGLLDDILGRNKDHRNEPIS